MATRMATGPRLVAVRVCSLAIEANSELPQQNTTECLRTPKWRLGVKWFAWQPPDSGVLVARRHIARFTARGDSSFAGHCVAPGAPLLVTDLVTKLCETP